SKKIGDLDHIPIFGGSFIDRARLTGLRLGTSVRNGQCVADLLEGGFWWTGTELRPVYVEKMIEPEPHWGHFYVTARLYTRKASTGSYAVGRKTTDWPRGLIVKLKNYPGLELWLNAVPPSAENYFSVKNFIIRDWRRGDGTPREIACDGLGSSRERTLKGGVTRAELLKFTKTQLENVDFGRLTVHCTVGLHDFDFAGGDARVGTGTESLQGAPIALQMINEYLSNSIITGK
ncbi:hypothetical protein, partial [Pseudomonas sp. 10S4]|uniref:hypothetical protein n=1 Tax=Pseudomonas sp. 10S4 TaxID=3048583 RepID=UPI002B23AE79